MTLNESIQAARCILSGIASREEQDCALGKLVDQIAIDEREVLCGYILGHRPDGIEWQNKWSKNRLFGSPQEPEVEDLPISPFLAEGDLGSFDL